MDTSAPRPITTRSDLIAFAARLEGVEEVGFDTEFHAEQTYWPKVMLLQFSTPEEVVLIDPLPPEVKASLGGFLELFRMRGQTIIGHALEKDLEIFLRLNGGLPEKVFDTQVAAAFLGHGGPISLSALLQARLGVEVDKLYSRADWGKRPLPPAQAEYAADDVRHLFGLAGSLRSELKERGRLEWVEEECRAALDPKRLLPIEPADAWRRVSRRPTPGSRAYEILVAVAAERERIAKETDRGPRRVLSDEVVVDLARRAPTEASDLESDTLRRPAPNLKKFAERWLDAIQVGSGADIRTAESYALSLEEQVACDAGQRVAEWVFTKHGVSPWLLPSWTEAWAELIRQPAETPEALRSRLGLSGWRAEVLAEVLWQVLGEGAPVRMTKGAHGLELSLPHPG